MRTDEYLYFTALGLQILASILVIFSLRAMGIVLGISIFIIVLGISILIKDLAWQLADDEIDKLKRKLKSQNLKTKEKKE